MKLALVLEKHMYKGINKSPLPSVYIVIYLLDHSFIQFFQRYLLSAYYVLGSISDARKSFMSKHMNIFWDCHFRCCLVIELPSRWDLKDEAGRREFTP